MLDNRELKKLLVVVLGISVLLGVFVGVRSCNKAEKNDEVLEDVQNNTNNDVDVEYKDDEEVENEVSNNESNINSNISSNQTNKEEKKDLVVTMQENYYVKLNNNFKVPAVSVDDSGNKVTTEITYEFMELDSQSYRKVMGVDTSKLGIYKVTYKISNGYKTIEKVVYINIIDEEDPVVSANIVEIKQENGIDIETSIPVENNAFINKNVYFAFSDNDKVAYAEYYKALKEIVDGKETIEKEAMQQIEEIDLNQPFFLDEDGEYHIRVVDRSGNTTEFIVTIDKTSPTAQNDKEVHVQNGDMEVSLTFDEKVQPVEGWKLSEDGKTITKSYAKDANETIKVKDLAGNEIDVPVKVEMTILVYQTVGNSTLELENNKQIVSVDGTDLTLRLKLAEAGDLEVLVDNTSKITKNLAAGDQDFDFVTENLWYGHGEYQFKFEDSTGKISIYNLIIADQLVNG